MARLLAGRVLDDVIAQLDRWGDAVGDLRVSVNVTMHDLTGPDLVDRLAERLVERGVPASRLQLEITEGALRSDPRAGLAALSRVQRLGVPIALDHFGTGTASLALLRRLPLAEVKIDRSFVLGAAARRGRRGGGPGRRRARQRPRAAGRRRGRRGRADVARARPRRVRAAGLVLRPADARRTAGQLGRPVPQPAAAPADLTPSSGRGGDGARGGQIDSPDVPRAPTTGAAVHTRSA